MYYKLQKFIPFALIAVAILFTYYQTLTSPPSMLANDLTKHAYEDVLLKNNFLNYHSLGLWDTTSGLGNPLIVNFASHFYPFTIFSYLIPNMLVAIRVLLILHLVLGGFACFYMLRTMRSNIIGAIYGSILFVVNYYVMSRVVSGSLAEIYNLV